MGKWVTRPLLDFVDPNRSICYGIVQPGSPVDNGVSIIRVNNFADGGLNTTDALQVSSEIEARYLRSRLEGGELLVTLVGSMGLTAIAPEGVRGWNVARAVGVIPLRAEANKRWINFVIRSKAAQEFIRARANTTVQATFNLSDLAKLPILCPPDPVRDALASMLSALDDKINLNRLMNDTLEANARAIFKDWFVEFGPTRAKVEGHTPYLAPNLWSMFPESLDEEGKPKGWERFSLGAVADQHTASITPSALPAEVFEHFSMPAYDAGKMPSDDRGETIKSNKTVIPNGSILLSKLNPENERVWIPEPANVNKQICSTEFLVFTPKKNANRPLLFGLFTAPSFRIILQSMVTGTSKSHQRISPPALLQRDVLTGSSALFSQYQFVAEPLLDRTLANRAESRNLADTRDLLLPKLMCGEISISNAEKKVGELV